MKSICISPESIFIKRCRSIDLQRRRVIPSVRKILVLLHFGDLFQQPFVHSYLLDLHGTTHRLQSSRRKILGSDRGGLLSAAIFIDELSCLEPLEPHQLLLFLKHLALLLLLSIVVRLVLIQHHLDEFLVVLHSSRLQLRLVVYYF